jgi:hypothetical protein
VLKNLLFHKPYVNSSFKGSKERPKKAEIRRFLSYTPGRLKTSNTKFSSNALEIASLKIDQTLPTNPNRPNNFANKKWFIRYD